MTFADLATHVVDLTAKLRAKGHLGAENPGVLLTQALNGLLRAEHEWPGVARAERLPADAVQLFAQTLIRLAGFWSERAHVYGTVPDASGAELSLEDSQALRSHIVKEMQKWKALYAEAAEELEDTGDTLEFIEQDILILTAEVHMFNIRSGGVVREGDDEGGRGVRLQVETLKKRSADLEARGTVVDSWTTGSLARLLYVSGQDGYDELLSKRLEATWVSPAT